MEFQDSEVLNKRNCPRCGAEVKLIRKNSQAQQSMDYFWRNQKMDCYWVCTNCGAEYEAKFYMNAGHPITEDSRVTIEVESPSIDILGQNNFGRR